MSSPKVFNYDIGYWAKVISEYFNIDFEEIKKANTLRNRNPKRWFYYICALNGRSYVEIAEYMGRERTSVSQNVQAFLRNQSQCSNFKQIEIQLMNYKLKENDGKNE